MTICLGRRQFIFALGGAAAAWPVKALAQQPSPPLVGLIRDGSADANASFAAAFGKGLSEFGYIEGRNVTVEHHWLDSHNDRVPAVIADLIDRQVAVIVTPGSVPAALAAKAATATIPIVFGVPLDPVRLGLVTSLARPGGNATGINFFVQKVAAKRLRLLRDLVPNAVRVAVLVNPTNVSLTESTVQEVQEVASTLALQISVLNAGTTDEIDTVFATFEQQRPDALFVGADAFFAGRGAQFATLTARTKIPAAYAVREIVTAGGLMSYGTDLTDMFRQAGVYTGNILKGAKPSDLPVVQSTKFEFAINLQTARALRIQVSPGILSIADDVVE
jgi:putative tryptophan/tyrosine transport system substrate-binding protein